LIWAIFWVLNVRDKNDEIIKLFINFSFGLVLLLVVFYLSGKSLPENPEAWISGIYVGIFEMGIAFIFWLKALKLTQTTDKISNLVYISPFFSLILIHYIAGERIYLTTPAGLILIVAGIILQKIKIRK
jgi:drug/metabolite transporter (DMT)-like permease